MTTGQWFHTAIVATFGLKGQHLEIKCHQAVEMAKENCISAGQSLPPIDFEAGRFKKKKIPDADQWKTFRWVDTLQMTAIFPWKSSDILTLGEATRTRKFCFILKNAPADYVSQPEGSLVCCFLSLLQRLEFCCCVFITGRSTKDGHQIETSTAKMRRTDSARYAPEPGARWFSLDFLLTSLQLYMFSPLRCAS